MNILSIIRYLPLALITLLPTSSQAAQTARVSVDSARVQGNNMSFFPSVSADGRFVAFSSYADNLVEGDTNGMADVFVHDRLTGKTTRISVNSDGKEGNNSSGVNSPPSISADGRFIAFDSYASNLVAGGCNMDAGIYIHNRLTGTTTCISLGSAGESGNAISYFPSVSADGRFVAFKSAASNLVVGDTNEIVDVFIRDRFSGKTTLVSVDSAEALANGESDNPSISADGRFVAFYSQASNLVKGDSNGTFDIFVRDITLGITKRLSINTAGVQGNNNSFYPSISANGRYVAFESGASNLVTDDTNERNDIFVRDRGTGITSRVSVDSTGAQGNNNSFNPIISADGHFVAFISSATNLVTGDTNGFEDIFVHDRLTSKTTRVSVNSAGIQGNNGSNSPSISADGRFVGFTSAASNLVAGDTNNAADIFIRDRLLNNCKQADIRLVITNQPASVKKGQDANYTFTIYNHGPNNAGSVTLIDTIAKGSVSSLTPSQGNCFKAAVSVCRFGLLATNASVTLTAIIKANGNPLTQKLTASAAPVDSQPANNSVTISTPVTP